MNFESYTSNSLEELSFTGIYAIVNQSNGKFYIGSTSRLGNIPSNSGFYLRWTNHINELKRGEHGNQHLQNAWNKYGSESFRFQILEFVEPNKCLEVEQVYLDLFPVGDRELVYNICFIAGSTLGVTCKDSTKEKISKANSKPFYLVSPEGDVVEGNNFSLFCKENSLERGSLKQVLAGKAFNHKGWTKSLENHKIYIKCKERRGIYNIKCKWVLRWREGSKSIYKRFITKKAAITKREELEAAGVEFVVKVRK